MIIINHDIFMINNMTNTRSEFRERANFPVNSTYLKTLFLSFSLFLSLSVY